MKSPKGSLAAHHHELDETVIEADDECSPERERDDQKFGKMAMINKQDSQNSKVNIENIENSDLSDDADSPEAKGSANEDADDEFAKRLKQSLVKQIDLPPPLELIAKRTYKEKEPVLTGAPIPFLSLASLAGGRFPKEEACGKTKA